MKGKSIFLLIVLIFVIVSATACSPAASNATTNNSATTSSSTLDGKSLVESKCTVCHNLDRVQSAHKDANGWKTTVERMVGKGAQLTAEEQSAIIDYLAKTYP
jgi:cytochrome c5